MAGSSSGARLPRRVTRRGLLQGVAALAALGAACRPTPPATPPPASGAGAAAPPSTGAAGGAPASAPSGTASVALARRQPLKLVWTATTGAQGGLYMAYETGAWRELGLDVELTRMNSSSTMASALRAGEIDGGPLDWALAFQFVAQGGNVRQVASVTDRQVFSIISIPSITQPQQVIGRRWGITRLGSSAHTGSLIALGVWGLKGDDVQFVQLQDVTAILTAMQAGQIDVGLMSPPTSLRARQAGLHELINLATEGPEYPSIGLGIREDHVADNPELVRAYVAGYAVGLARFRQDREQAIAVLKKYLQLDDERVLGDTYDVFAQALAWPPLVPMAALARVKDDVAADEPKVGALPLEAVADPRFVQELDAAGYFRGLS
jgi:NitT/TauT family transport system substrate-binding protein